MKVVTSIKVGNTYSPFSIFEQKLFDSDFSVISSWILAQFSTIETGKHWSTMKGTLSVWDIAFPFRICKTEFYYEYSKV